MARRSTASVFARAYERNLRALTKATLSNSKRIAGQVQRATAKRLKPPPGKGDWLAGVAMGPGGARGYHLFRPAGLELQPGEQSTAFQTLTTQLSTAGSFLRVDSFEMAASTRRMTLQGLVALADMSVSLEGLFEPAAPDVADANSNATFTSSNPSSSY